MIMKSLQLLAFMYPLALDSLFLKYRRNGNRKNEITHTHIQHKFNPDSSDVVDVVLQYLSFILIIAGTVSEIGV